MFSKAPVITNAGKTLLLRSMDNTKIKFTKFQAGNGTMRADQTEETMTELNSVQLEISDVSSSQSEDEGYINIEGSFDNQNNVHHDLLCTE